MEIGVCRSANGSILYHTIHYGNESRCIIVLNFHNAPIMANTECIMEIPYRNRTSFVTVMNSTVKNTTVITPAHKFPFILQSKPIPKVIVQQYFK